jgi:hypothetical protein
MTAAPHDHHNNAFFCETNLCSIFNVIIRLRVYCRGGQNSGVLDT